MQRHLTAIVLAAGRGERLKSRVSKPLAAINSQAMILYCLRTFSRIPEITDIVVVANNANLSDIKNKIRQCGIAKVKGIVLGGRRRQDSVLNGLKALDKNTDLVLVHDAARPFIDRKSISKVIARAKKCGAAILGVPVKATIKKAKNSLSGPAVVEQTIDRKGLWEIQTPQVFRREIISKAYRRFHDRPVTDDAGLVERLGFRVDIVEGSALNIKITTPEDLTLAKAIARRFK